MIKVGKLYISAFVPVLILTCICAESLDFMLLAYLSLAVHEIFHLIFALKMKIKVDRVTVLPFGINIKISENISPVYEILLCAMGPAGSAVSALIFIYLKHIGIELKYTDYMILSNLSIFIINVLPIYPLDGGRIFKCILESKTGYYRAVNISVWISQLCVFIMGVFIFTAVVGSNFNLSIVILCCFLIFSISRQKNEAVLSFSKLLLYSKQKLEKRQQITVREIAVSERARIKEILKMFSDSVYIMVSVTDTKGKILCRMSETELIEQIRGCKYARFISEII